MSEKPVYLISKEERDNWLALFEEMQLNGANGQAALFAWWTGEQYLIEQSIMELTTAEEITDYDEDNETTTLHYGSAKSR